MAKKSTFDLNPDQLKRLLDIGTQGLGSVSDEEPGTSDQEESCQTLTDKPGSWIGRYRIIRILGEGGMGLVYLAEQEHPVKREVALKVIKPGMDSKHVIARFEAERQAMAIMDHPGIARIHDAGTTEEGRPYFVMEYVKGLPITEYCDQKQLGIEARLRLFQRVCAGVQYAHQKGIIHRDLKPSNILVWGEDDRTVTKIIDFGVAKALSKPLTGQSLTIGQGQLLGTPDYMSPEQVESGSQASDVRTDVYSLGVVLYVLLAGSLPFDTTNFGEGDLSTLRKLICEDDPKTPSAQISALGKTAVEIATRRGADVKALVRRLQKELEWIPLKAMNKEPNRRYQSAAGLADDVQNYLTGAPLVAGPPSVMYRVKKLVRRNKTLVASLLAVFVVLTAGAIVSTLFAINEAHARKEAERQTRISEAVTRFFNQDVLFSASPFRMGGHETTVTEALKVASRKLDGRFNDEPLIEASIRYTLGQTYMYLGYFSMSEPQLQAALRIYEEQFGEEDLRTLWAGRSLGHLYDRQGRYAEAESLFRKALATYRKKHGDRNESTLLLMFDITRLYIWQARYDEGALLCAEVLEGRRKVFGKDHPYTLNSEIWLAMFWHYQGRSEEAESLLTKTLRKRIELYGEEHPHTTTAMAWLGYMYRDLERYEEAERWLENALEIDRRVLGGQHISTLCCMNALATVYMGQKRYDEAERLFIEALRSRHFVFGDDHPHIFESMNDLGVLYLQQQEHDKAEPLLARAARGRTQKLGLDHPDTVETFAQLAKLYEKRIPKASFVGTLNLNDLLSAAMCADSPAVGPVAMAYNHVLSEDSSTVEMLDNDRMLQYVDERLTINRLKTFVMRHGGICSSIGRIEYEKATETYTIAGSGQDIWLASDQFHFAHKQLTGEGSIVVRLESIEDVHLWAKAGVMIRETLDPNAAYVAVVITPENRICLQYRTRAGQNAHTIQSNPNLVTLPHWMKLLRKEDKFIAQHSRDGLSWKDLRGSNSIDPVEQDQIPASVTIPMNEEVYVGMAVTSHGGPFITATAMMSKVKVTGDVSPEGQFIWSEDIGFQMIALPRGHAPVYKRVAE